jgi:hypothetical protein
VPDTAAAPHPGELSRLFHYVHHPRAAAHVAGTAAPPPKVRDQARRDTPIHRFNSSVGLGITVVVGTMWCAYLFTVIAFLSFWQAITSKNLVIIIGWLSSNFLQLVLLPVIIVGQNLQAKASDQRAASTYEDAEAVLHEALQIQQHLAAQDAVLSELVARVQRLGGGAAAPAAPEG